MSEAKKKLPLSRLRRMARRYDDLERTALIVSARARGYISGNPDPDPHNKLPNFRPTQSWSKRYEARQNQLIKATMETAKPMPVAPPAPKGAAKGPGAKGGGDGFRTSRRLFAGRPARIILDPNTGDEVEVDGFDCEPSTPSTVCFGASQSMGGKKPEPT